MTKGKSDTLRTGPSRKWLNQKLHLSVFIQLLLCPLLILGLLLDNFQILTTRDLDRSRSRVGSRTVRGTFFVTFGNPGPHSQPTGVFNVENQDIGGPSIGSKGHLDQKKNLNDKYSFYNPYNPDLGESVYHDKLISQARYFDIKEEEFFNKGLATVKGNLKRNISFWEEIDQKRL